MPRFSTGMVGLAAPRQGRDLRVDFFRGLALWWIFVDHVPHDVLGALSIRNFALCDATEIFVFLAGFAGGMAYGQTLDRQGWLYAGADSLRRAWTLYIAHIFLFVVFSAQVAWSAAALSRTDYLDEIHLDVIGNHPYRALLEALTLHFQPAYLNILPMYIVLLAGFALVLPLLRAPWWLAALSALLYLGVQVFGWNFPSWTGGTWFFDPMAWQALFVLGALISYRRPGIAAFARPWPRFALDALAILTLLFGLWLLAFWQHQAWAAYLPAALVRWLNDVPKATLHPLRFTSFLALAWLARRLVSPAASWVRSRWARPFVIAGQHSLPVFCFGIFASFVGRVVMEQGTGPARQILVNVVGTAALAAVGGIAAWYKRRGKRPEAASTPTLVAAG